MKHRELRNGYLLVCTAALLLTVGACDDGVVDAPSEGVSNEMSALEILTDLEGKKYILDVPNPAWVEPEGFAEENVKVQPQLAFEVVEINEASLSFTALLGAAREGVQDRCTLTSLVPGTISDDGDPVFTLGPVDMQILFEGPESKALTNAHDVTITGQFVDDGVTLESASLEALLDTREAYPLFYKADAASGEELCAMAAEWDEDICETCTFEPDTDLCIFFAADDFAVSETPDLVLSEIAEIDATCI